MWYVTFKSQVQQKLYLIEDTSLHQFLDDGRTYTSTSGSEYGQFWTERQLVPERSRTTAVHKEAPSVVWLVFVAIVNRLGVSNHIGLRKEQQTEFGLADTAQSYSQAEEILGIEWRL